MCVNLPDIFQEAALPGGALWTSLTQGHGGGGKHRASRSWKAGLVSSTAFSWLGDLGQAGTPP